MKLAIDKEFKIISNYLLFYPQVFAFLTALLGQEVGEI